MAIAHTIGGQRQPEPGRDAEDEPAGQSADEVDGDPGRDRDRQRRQDVHPERGLTERLQDDRSEPAEQDVRREPGRVRRAHQRAHRLELAGVPEADARQHRQPAGDQGDDADQDRSGQPRVTHHPSYHPSNTPQITPHRLMATDSDEEGHRRQHAPAPRSAVAARTAVARPDQALEAQRDQQQRERRRVVAEPVAELDPALAEVHQVERPDRDDRDPRAPHDPTATEPPNPRSGSASRYPGLVSSTLMPVSRGTASGHATSNSPRPASGSRQTGIALIARLSGSVGREDVRRPEQRDPEVLRHVAHVLDRPRLVVAKGRVAGRLEPVQVLVRRVDDATRGDHVEPDQDQDRQRCPETGRPCAPPPIAARADEDEEWRPDHDRQAGRPGQSEQQPGRELAPVDRESRQPPSSPSGHPTQRRRVAVERHTDRQHRQSDGKDVGLVPGRGVLGGVPEDRPEGEEDRRPEAHEPPDRQTPDHPPADGHVDRGEDREDPLVVSGQPPDRHERQEEDRGQRRERQDATRDAVGSDDRQDVLEPGVAGQVGRCLDRVADRRMTLEERRRLPHEVVVVTVRVRQRVHDQGHEGEEAPDRDRRQAFGSGWQPPIWREIRTGVRLATLCYAPIHLPRSCRSRSR